MLPKLFDHIDKNGNCIIRKFVSQRDMSTCGAFEYGAVIDFEVSVSRALGAMGLVMRICRDGEGDVDTPLEFAGSDGVNDIYTISLDTKVICGANGSGLFYYELLFLRGDNTLFTDSYNNFDFDLSDREGSRFRLLVFESGYKTPDTFGKGVMYHIFVDRFCKGEGNEVDSIECKSDAVINPDWENGIPQYARVQGAHLNNNEFFGGNLYGVIQKLDYLKSLGVKTIYLSPIFEAYSNHKYDTADYFKVDSMFGGDKALDELIARAREYGIGIILDGVFNHTGDNSIYFNKYGKYDSVGAYNSYESPYKDWYHFKNWPDSYESWWGIEVLPKLNHQNDSCREMIVGEEGVIRKYLRKGIVGWRLDVADELSDRVLDEIRAGAKDINSEAVIIGEVWENAADKIAYGKRRRYLSGRQLDSVMNYPLRNAIIDFCQYGEVETIYNTLVEIYSSYPACVCHKLMNLLGTHDTERITTVLGSDVWELDGENDELAYKRLSKNKREYATDMLKIASVLQYTAYGIPSVFYGDEVGIEGYHDPFCRMPFPWHQIENEDRTVILRHYSRLGNIRNENICYDGGDFYVIHHSDGCIAFARKKDDNLLITVANRGKSFCIDIPYGEKYTDLLTGRVYVERMRIPSDTAMILEVGVIAP